jgi:hypothetical protein
LATFKHISSKNADYGAAEQYLTFEHDEFTMKPTLDENGLLIPRGYKFYKVDSFAEIHIAANNSWYRFRKVCKSEENMYRIPHRTIYDTLSSLIRFSSEELYFLFLGMLFLLKSLME